MKLEKILFKMCRECVYLLGVIEIYRENFRYKTKIYWSRKDFGK